VHRQQRWPERSHWAGGILLAVIVVLLLNVIAKILWDWLDLLSVPIVLAIGGYLFTRSETQATQVAAELFAIKPFWLTSQLAEYHKDPDRLFRPVCVAVAAVILGDAGRWEEVKEEVEKELGGRG
jgi:hypothetical protein